MSNYRKHFIELDDRYHGYRIVVMLQDAGHRCGYVFIPKEVEPYFKDAGKTEYGENVLAGRLLVHGGITFDQYVDDTEYLPETGHWIGFDCAHCDDGRDWDSVAEHFGSETADKWRKAFNDDVYKWELHIWTKEEVTEECKYLVDQLCALEPEYVI